MFVLAPIALIPAALYCLLGFLFPRKRCFHSLGFYAQAYLLGLATMLFLSFFSGTSNAYYQHLLTSGYLSQTLFPYVRALRNLMFFGGIFTIICFLACVAVYRFKSADQKLCHIALRTASLLPLILCAAMTVLALVRLSHIASLIFYPIFLWNLSTAFTAYLMEVYPFEINPVGNGMFMWYPYLFIANLSILVAYLLRSPLSFEYTARVVLLLMGNVGHLLVSLSTLRTSRRMFRKGKVASGSHACYDTGENT